MSNSVKDANDFIVTAEDAVAAGFCIQNGLRVFLENRGYSLKEFIRHGLPAQTVIAFNDAQSDRVLAKARERLNGS